MRRIAVTALVLILVAAGSSARGDGGSRLKLAREIVDVTHLADKIRGLLPSLAPTVRHALSQELVDAATSEKAVLLVQNPSPEDLGQLMDRVAALYARELTEKDLSDALAFYRTPSGRDMLAKEAEIGGAIGAVAVNWAVTLANRTAADSAKAKPSPASDRWRVEYITAPSRAAVLREYLDPMEKPEWTALRTVTLAKLIAQRCRGVQLNERVLYDFWHRSGLGAVDSGGLDLMNAVVAPAFSYFDVDRLKLVCAASDDLFGANGRLVPNLLSSGDGLPNGIERGYIPVPAITNVPHGKG